MKNLELESMYHKFLFLGVILFTLFFSCTPKSALKQEHTHSSSFNDTVTILTQHFDKIVLRMDTDGYLRTHRASLSSSKNNFIFFTVISNLKKTQASIVFDTLGLKIIDTQSNSGYYLSYDHLSTVFGFPLNIKTVQNFIFGFPNYKYADSLLIRKLIGKNKTNFSAENSIPFVQTDFTSKGKLAFLSINNNADYIFRSRYNHHKNLRLPFPLTTNIKLVYNEQQMEFEIEFDRKHFFYNGPVDLTYDTLAPLKEIPIANE